MKRLALALICLGCLWWLHGLSLEQRPLRQEFSRQPQPSRSTVAQPSAALESLEKRAPATAPLAHRKEIHPVDAFSTSARRLALEENKKKIMVHVLEQATGRALPLAEVFVLSTSQINPQRMATFLAESRSLDAFFEEHGTRHVADEQGLLLLDEPLEETFLIGRRPGLWAMQVLEYDQAAMMRLELKPNSSARARVLDSQGRPAAGVPVCLRTYRIATPDNTHKVWTDASGIATLPSLQDPGGGAIQNEGLFLAVPTPLGPLVEVPLDREKHNEPLELVLPPYGCLRVHLLDAEEQPITENHVLKIRWDRPESPGLAAKHKRSGSYTCLLSNGQLELFPVGLGLKLECIATTLQGAEVGYCLVPGPQHPGEWVEIRLQAAHAPQWSGFLRLPDASPAAGYQVQLKVSWSQESAPGLGSGQSKTKSRNLTFSTSPDGSFQVEVPDDLLASPRATAHLDFLAHDLRGEAPGNAQPFQVEFTLGPNPKAASLSLGILTLSPCLALLSGQVMDANGVPIGGAQLSFSPGPFQASSEDAMSGRDGRFTIYDTLVKMDTPTQTGLWLDITHPKFLPRTNVEAQRSTSWEIVMESPASLRGQLALPPYGQQALQTLELHRLPEFADQKSQRIRSKLDAEGNFAFQDLTPGNYQLSARLSFGQSNLPIGMALSLLPGQALDLGRVPIDPDFHVLKLSVNGRAASPKGFHLRYRTPAGKWKLIASAREGQPVYLGTTQAQLDIKINATGFETRIFEGLRGEQRLTLFAASPRR